MQEMIGVLIDKKIEYFYTNHLKLKKNITVVVEKDKGIQFGKVITDPRKCDMDFKINKILRISTKSDYYNYKKNKKDAKEALKKCREIVREKNINMNILDANYNLNRNQLIFRFIADNRVDFRELAKDLASIYKTRIELRQIGIRDKSKEVGGLGICGRSMCCCCFLKEFASVSIAMAKNQNISLNPNKINGTCGRLLCCLKYENDNYSDCKKNLPTEGSIVETESGIGKVVSVDVLNKKYLVDIEGNGIIEIKK